MEQRPSVFIHIVTWNSQESIAECIEAAAAQDGYTLGDNLLIHITDNASTDETLARVAACVRSGISLERNTDNLGFCAGHNQGVTEFLRSGFAAFLVLNPDVGLRRDCLTSMAKKLCVEERVGLVTPKLLRALPSLEAIYPPVLDAAGMHLTRACRHFDRGAGDWDRGQFEKGEFVFGGTGACLLLSRDCVVDLCIPKSISDEEVFAIYPQLRSGSSERRQLFDEAFFAYREDADLSWRAKQSGWRCWYEPKASATHVRVVTPERRLSLPAILNRYSVRNRFLLQINNWRLRDGLLFFVWGIIIRNLVVLSGVLLWERTSLEGIKEAYRLAPRARRIRRWMRSQRKAR
jgi:GT2 family glycosyltransferase